MNRRLLFLYWWTALLIGCEHDRNLKETLSDTDVLGKWTMTGESLLQYRLDKFSPDPSHLYTLTFRADGTCSFASILNNGYGGTYLVADGTWQLEHDTHGADCRAARNAISIELAPK